MALPTPNLDTGATFSIAVLRRGQPIDSTAPLITADIWVEGGLPPEALTTFQYSHGDRPLAVGDAIEIRLGYTNTKDSALFNGTVASMRMETAEAGGLILSFRAFEAVPRANDVKGQPPVLQLEYGKSILSCSLDVDDRNRMGGQLVTYGTALAMPGAKLRLSGIDAGFDRDIAISAVHHHVEGGVWQTTVGTAD